MRPRWIGLPLAALLCWPHAAAAQDAQKGRDIAVAHCSRCHVIPDHNAFGGIGSTPSFQLLADLDDGLERFDTFFARRPHPSIVRIAGVDPPTAQGTSMAPVLLKQDDIDDLVAYARRLRETKE